MSTVLKKKESRAEGEAPGDFGFSLPVGVPLLGPAHRLRRSCFSAHCSMRSTFLESPGITHVQGCWSPPPAAPRDPSGTAGGVLCQLLALCPLVFWSLRPSGWIVTLQSPVGREGAGPLVPLPCPEDDVPCYPGSNPGSRFLPRGPCWCMIPSKPSQSRLWTCGTLRASRDWASAQLLAQRGAGLSRLSVHFLPPICPALFR